MSAHAGPPTLEDRVRETLNSHGWTSDGVRGREEFLRTLRRVTFRGALADFVAVARGGGLPALDALLERENAGLEREAARNAFRERRLARELPRTVADRLERTLGPVTLLDEDGRKIKPRKP